ncbi:hypothetical protein ACKI2N_030395 [Cupriavidus sp. 30B13]|uniref:hypothetical protein n=1 Tax=Cupriavidus sp. 30B13 TaxID=3384241 RepID=UPI003B90D7A8
MIATREQGSAATDGARRVSSLRGHAARFRKFVSACLAHDGFLPDVIVACAGLPGDEEESFTLHTAVGRLYAQFGFAKWDGRLVARYLFSRFTLGEDLKARLVPFHAILIEEEGRATFAEDGVFEWEIPDAFQSGHHYGPALTRTLLDAYQESLPKFDRPR